MLTYCDFGLFVWRSFSKAEKISLDLGKRAVYYCRPVKFFWHVYIKRGGGGGDFRMFRFFEVFKFWEYQQEHWRHWKYGEFSSSLWSHSVLYTEKICSWRITEQFGNWGYENSVDFTELYSKIINSFNIITEFEIFYCKVRWNLTFDCTFW